MAGTRKLTIEIVGDAKDASKAFSDVESSSDKMGKGVANAGKVAGVALLGIVGGAALLTPQILATGAELEALGKKSATVFEESLGDVKAWAAANAAAMGLTQDRAVGLAAGFGDLLKPMGFTAAQAAKMSTEVVGLSGALSAWTGGTTSAAEVTDILSKAMLGETDGLKALGISISAADIAARLAADGNAELTGAAREQAEALAIQALIMEKSTDAQTAWTNGSMDSIKAQNESKASMNELKDALITAVFPALQALVPIITTVAEWLGVKLPIAIAALKVWWEENLTPAIKAIGELFGKLVDWTREHWDEISAKITAVVDAVRAVIDVTVGYLAGLWRTFGDEIMAVAKLTWDFISSTVQAAMTTIQGIIDLVMGILKGDWGRAWDGIKQIVEGVWLGIKARIEFFLGLIPLLMSAAWDAIAATADAAWERIKSTVGDGIDEIVEFVKSVPGRLLDLVDNFAGAGIALGKAIIKGVAQGFESLVGGATDVARAFANAIVGFVNKNVIDRINDMLEFKIKVPLGPDISIDPPDLPRIPTFGVGGIMRGDGLAFVHDREGIFTADQMAALGGGIGGGVTVYVTVAGSVVSERDLIRSVYDGIIDGQRRGELVAGIV